MQLVTDMLFVTPLFRYTEWPKKVSHYHDYH